MDLIRSIQRPLEGRLVDDLVLHDRVAGGVVSRKSDPVGIDGSRVWSSPFVRESGGHRDGGQHAAVVLEGRPFEVSTARRRGHRKPVLGQPVPHTADRLLRGHGARCAGGRLGIRPFGIEHRLMIVEGGLDEAGVRPGPGIRCGCAGQEQDDRNDGQSSENPDRQEDSLARLAHNL